MGVAELKRELQKMIEQENDINILKALRTILEKTRLDPVLKEKLGQSIKLNFQSLRS